MRSGRSDALGRVIGAILAATLALSPVHARKKQADLPPPTTGLVDNVNGIAVGKGGALQRFNGLLIGGDGRVERRLSRDDKRPDRLLYRLDGEGRTLIPSFIDSHTNVIAAGLTVMTLDLSTTGSLADALSKVTSNMRANPGKKWILGRGWDAARWARISGQPERLPTAADLDTAVSDRPAFLLSDDGEMGWANTVALRQAGIAAPQKALTGEALRKMRLIVPSPAPKDRDIALDKAQQLYLARGISTVADMGTTIEDWQAYRRAGDRGAIRLRIVGYADTVENMALIAGSAPSPWLYEDHLRLSGVLFTLDGTLAARTAWIKAPLAGTSQGPTGGRIEQTRLRNWMSRAAMDGFQIAIAAHGDAAFAEAVDAIGELAATYGGDRRWRIEGPEQIDTTGTARLIAPGTYISVSRASLDAFSSAAGGSERTFLFSSGASALPASPFDSLAAAMRHSMPAGEPDGSIDGFAPAFSAATSVSAFALFGETRIGSLASGQHADFLILDRDISTASPDAIEHTRILEHWIDGKRVFKADAAGNM
ncbi:MAG: amidohydrolase family protein [Sphingobium sp.]